MDCLVVNKYNDAASSKVSISVINGAIQMASLPQMMGIAKIAMF